MTYLYIKQHNQTGLRYFGKTTRDPYRYIGSGLHWRRHIKKHGKDIATIWTMQFDDEADCEDFAVLFSELFDIVASAAWANMKIENGRDGWPAGVPNPRSVPQSVETRAKKSAKLKGTTKSAHYAQANGNYGKPMPEERKEKMRATKAANPTAKPWTAERRARVAATWAMKKAGLNNTQIWNPNNA